uniref:Cathepsin L-like n=1 Tax=Onchocerca flexuosa TaxID=387005 RepID=A0A183GZH7_9BILA
LSNSFISSFRNENSVLKYLANKAFFSQVQQLREVLGTFDQDYKHGNMTRLTTDFKRALKKYGDGFVFTLILLHISRKERLHPVTFSQKSTVLQSFLKKMEDNGELRAIEKLETEWNDYVTVLGKHYDSNEANLRMAIFESNELMTEQTNRKYKQGLISYTNGLNHLADLTDEEFSMMNGLRFPNETHLHSRRQTRQATSQKYSYDPMETLPESVDWRKKGFVTRVKNQGVCGSCYAFAAIGALEAYQKKEKRKLVDLSIQNAVDCTWQLGNYGCRGGYMNPIFYYATKQGIALESKYPYVGTERSCKWKKEIAYATDRGYAVIERGDELALKHAVAKRGPVVVGINGSKRAFRFYRAGVYSSRNCGDLNHAVLVVGYGKHKKHGEYWIVKNSWGTDWGRKGYVYMARNQGNMCHIASLASIPI